MSGPVSASFPAGLPPLRSEAEVRARRAALEASMRAEGTPEHVISDLATEDTAARMIAHEDQVVGMITRIFTQNSKGQTP